MKEFELKYGCNPNQKPAKIYMREGGDLPITGGLLSFSLSKGLNRLSSRLGADVIVIPQGSEINDQTVLLQGDSKYTYLPQGSLEFIRGLDGVEIATLYGLYVPTSRFTHE